jgi:hypothetical protein
LEGEHTVVHGGETGGNRLVIPWVRGNDRISNDDIGAWRLMELLFSVAWRHVALAQDAGLHGGVCVLPNQQGCGSIRVARAGF